MEFVDETVQKLVCDRERLWWNTQNLVGFLKNQNNVRALDKTIQNSGPNEVALQILSPKERSVKPNSNYACYSVQYIYKCEKVWSEAQNVNLKVKESICDSGRNHYEKNKYYWPRKLRLLKMFPHLNPILASSQTQPRISVLCLIILRCSFGHYKTSDQSHSGQNYWKKKNLAFWKNCE